MQQAHYVRLMHADLITGRPEGGGHSSMSTSLNTSLIAGTNH